MDETYLQYKRHAKKAKQNYSSVITIKVSVLQVKRDLHTTENCVTKVKYCSLQVFPEKNGHLVHV